LLLGGMKMKKRYLTIFVCMLLMSTILPISIANETETKDNSGIDSSRIYIYIDGVLIERQLYSFDKNTGILGFNWDTTYMLDGVHQITIIAFDEEGNRSETSINVTILNGFFNWRTWAPWVLVITGLIIFSFISYKIVRRKLRIRKESCISFSVE